MSNCIYLFIYYFVLDFFFQVGISVGKIFYINTAKFTYTSNEIDDYILFERVKNAIQVIIENNYWFSLGITKVFLNKL